MSAKPTDLSQFAASTRGCSGGRAETEDVSRANLPQRETRPQAEQERHPDYYRKYQMDKWMSFAERGRG